MQMLYNSDSFAVVMFDVSDESAEGSGSVLNRGGYEIVDKFARKEIFIEGALVGGEFESPHPFWAHNRKLIREVEELEHRARRPDVLVDERAIRAFYDACIPPNAPFRRGRRGAISLRPLRSRRLCAEFTPA